MSESTPSDRPLVGPVETEMVDGFSADRAVLALQKAFISKMDSGKWHALGYELGMHDLVEGHPRLLRSLAWGDEDYGGAIFQVLPSLLGDKLQNLARVEQFIGLRKWLEKHEPKLHAELYGGLRSAPTVPLEEIEHASGIHDIAELNRHAARIRSGIHDDPEQAIGSAKELLETVLKTIVGTAAADNDEIPSLIKKARIELDLDPQGADAKTADILKRTVSNLSQVVVGVAEIRNLYGTGHGRTKTRELEIAHARLVVNAAITLATFLLEVWRARTGGGRA